MLKLIGNRLVSFSVLGLLLLGAVPATTQETSSARRQSAFTIAHDLLEASYPEMFGKGWYIGFTNGQPVDDPRGWDKNYSFEFKVERFGPGVSWNLTYNQGKLIPPPENQTFLEGSFRMDYNDRFDRLIVDGDLAYSKQNKAIGELVESHPEWSGDEAIAALKKSGARYGPADKQEFLQAIHLDKYERSLGRLQIRLVEFQDLNPDHTGSFAAGSLFWVVQAEGRCSDGTPCTYSFSFEPFAGKLTGLSCMMDRSLPSEKQPVTR